MSKTSQYSLDIATINGVRYVSLQTLIEYRNAIEGFTNGQIACGYLQDLIDKITLANPR